MHELTAEEKEKRAAVVANEYAGILPYCEAFYLLSIHYSAERCLESFQKYEEIKTQKVDPDYLVSIVQEAVGHAAALSRYFWPSPQGRKKQPHLLRLKSERGKKLRKSFGLNDASSLYNRELRNAWEHFDERLDMYLLETDSGMFFPKSIIGSHTKADDPLGHIFKLLDPEEECLVLMGCKYFFAPIRDEVVSIYNEIFNKEGGRLDSLNSAL